MGRLFRRLISLALIGVALSLLSWGISRMPRSLKARPMLARAPAGPAIYPSPPALKTPIGPMVQASPTPQPPTYEHRTMTVEWPRRLRQGDGDWVRVHLEVDQQGRITPTLVQPGHDVVGRPVFFPAAYVTHLLTLQARLDAAGLTIAPRGLVSASLEPNRPVSFIWSVRGEEPGRYQAVLTLQLRLTPRSGGSSQVLALAQEVLPIEVVSYWGLSGPWVRLLGSLSGMLSLLLAIPDLLELWDRLRAKTDEEAQERTS